MTFRAVIARGVSPQAISSRHPPTEILRPDYIGAQNDRHGARLPRVVYPEPCEILLPINRDQDDRRRRARNDG
jgi:hypothetical protein